MTLPEDHAALGLAAAARAEVDGDPQRAVDLLVLAIQAVAPVGASPSDEQIMLQRAGAKLHDAMVLLRDIRAAFGRVERGANVARIINATIERDGSQVSSYTITLARDDNKLVLDVYDLSGDLTVTILTRTAARALIENLERAIGWLP